MSFIIYPSHIRSSCLTLRNSNELSKSAGDCRLSKKSARDCRLSKNASDCRQSKRSKSAGSNSNNSKDRPRRGDSSDSSMPR